MIKSTTFLLLIRFYIYIQRERDYIYIETRCEYQFSCNITQFLIDFFYAFGVNNTYVIKKKGQNQLPLKISKFKNLTNAQNGPKITKKLITSLGKKN